MKKFYLLIYTLLLLPLALFSQWSTDSTVNTPVCVQPNHQTELRTIPDGNGGAFLCWEDGRNLATDLDIYAQHVDANGNMLWAINGVAVCTALNGQQRPRITSDGAGGIVIAWEDRRDNLIHVYVQRLNQNGFPQWQTDGLSMTTGQSTQPEIITTTGGVIVAWNDARYSPSPDSIFLQKITSDGQVQWTTDGINSKIATGPWINLLSDNSGGAVIAGTGTATPGIFAQRVNGNGMLLWGQGGKMIYNAEIFPFYQPSMFGTTDGNYIITWPYYHFDDQTLEEFVNIYAQKFDTNGNILWQPGGARATIGDRKQYEPNAVSDGNGGVIIASNDRFDFPSGKIFAQHLDGNGNRLWGSVGKYVGNLFSPNPEEYPIMVEDGAGGAFVTWARKDGNKTIEAQHINASGDKLWSPNGETISNPASQTLEQYQRAAPDGNCGIIVFWEDNRYDLTDVNSYRADIYGTHVDCNTVIVPVKLLSFTGRNAGEKNLLEWSTALEQNTKSFTVEKSVDGSSFNPYKTLKAAGNTTQTTRYEIYDDKPYSGITHYRLKETDIDGTNIYSSIVNLKNKKPILQSVYPNPSNGMVNIELNKNVSLLEITVLDVVGKTVYHDSQKNAGAGLQQQIDLRQQSRGTYFIKLRSDEETVIKKVVIL